MYTHSGAPAPSIYPYPLTNTNKPVPPAPQYSAYTYQPPPNPYYSGSVGYAPPVSHQPRLPYLPAQQQPHHPALHASPTAEFGGPSHYAAAPPASNYRTLPTYTSPLPPTSSYGVPPALPHHVHRAPLPQPLSLQSRSPAPLPPPRQSPPTPSLVQAIPPPVLRAQYQAPVFKTFQDHKRRQNTLRKAPTDRDEPRAAVATPPPSSVGSTPATSPGISRQPSAQIGSVTPQAAAMMGVAGGPKPLPPPRANSVDVGFQQQHAFRPAPIQTNLPALPSAGPSPRASTAQPQLPARSPASPSRPLPPAAPGVHKSQPVTPREVVSAAAAGRPQPAPSRSSVPQVRPAALNPALEALLERSNTVSSVKSLDRAELAAAGQRPLPKLPGSVAPSRSVGRGGAPTPDAADRFRKAIGNRSTQAGGAPPSPLTASAPTPPPAPPATSPAELAARLARVSVGGVVQGSLPSPPKSPTSPREAITESSAEFASRVAGMAVGEVRPPSPRKRQTPALPAVHPPIAAPPSPVRTKVSTPVTPTVPAISVGPPPTVPTINAAQPSRPPVPAISIASASPPKPQPSKPAVPAIMVGGAPDVPTITIGGTPQKPTVPEINVPEDTGSAHSSPGFSFSGLPTIEVSSAYIPDAGPSPVPSISVGSGSGSAGSCSKRSDPRTEVRGPAAAAPKRIQANGAILCAGCCDPIIGRIVRAMNQRWHPRCFQCGVCGELLEHVSAYEHDGKPYCHLDYHDRFAHRCHHCKTPIIDPRFITLDDDVLGQRYYHELHFFCSECGDPFLDPSKSSAPGTEFGRVPRAGGGGGGGGGADDDDDDGENETNAFVIHKGHPYCERCHLRLHKPKCKACRAPIPDVVVNAMGGKYHAECFVCAKCDHPFANNLFFPSADGQAFCIECFEAMAR